MVMVRVDGPGGGGEAVSGDGLIFPEAFWGRSRDLDTEAIRASAASLRALGVDVSGKMDGISAVWDELPASYVSPEAWRVYTLMGPAVSKVDGVEDRFDKGARCLETFADELGVIKPVLADLERRANVFRAKALAGVEVTSTQVYPSGQSSETTSTLGWKEDTVTVEKNKALLGEYHAIVEQITMSSDTCARGLRILAGTQQWLTIGGGGQVGVITADQLGAVGDLPFGAPVAEDRSCSESVGDGITDFGRGIGEGAGMLLLGYNPETGDWFDEGAYGQAWGGLGNLAGSLAVMGMFAVPGVNAVLAGVAGHDEQVAGWIDDRADVVVGAGGSLIGYDHATGQAGGDGWHQWKGDGVRTATTSVLNIGTFFIPGAGAIGGGAKAGSIAAKVGSAASVAAEVIIPGGSWLLKGGVNAVRFGETAVTVARGSTAAVIDTTRLTKAGVLTSLDNITERVGHTPTRPRLTDSFNLDNVTKPSPSTPGTPGGLRVDTPTNQAPGHLPDTHRPTKPVPEPKVIPAGRGSHVDTPHTSSSAGRSVPEVQGRQAAGTGGSGKRPDAASPHQGIETSPVRPEAAPYSAIPDTSNHPMFDPDTARTVEAEIHDAFGENPYKTPDYTRFSAPENVPAHVGAAEAGHLDLSHSGQVTNSIDTTPTTGGHLGTGGGAGGNGAVLADGGHIVGPATGGESGGNGVVPSGSGGGGGSGVPGGGSGGAGHPLPDIADLAHLKHAGRVDEWAREVADRHPTLTTDEVKAIYEYTTSPGDGGSINFHEMNSYLRDPFQFDPAQRDFIQSRIDLATSGMSKLDSVPGGQFRGTNLPAHVLDSWQTGATVSDSAFTSSSVEVDAAEAFRGDGNAFIEIKGRTGVDVNPLSRYEGSEAEILFRPGARFVVRERTWMPAGGNGYWRFVVEEVMS